MSDLFVDNNVVNNKAELCSCTTLTLLFLIFCHYLTAPCNVNVNANPSDRCNCKKGHIKDKAGKKIQRIKLMWMTIITFYVNFVAKFLVSFQPLNVA